MGSILGNYSEQVELIRSLFRINQALKSARKARNAQSPSPESRALRFLNFRQLPGFLEWPP
jgi:hypothetical protein